MCYQCTQIHKKRKQNDTSNAQPDAEQPKPLARRRSQLFANQTQHAQHAIRKIITCTQAYFGADTAATTFDELKKQLKQFRMRNDTEGASFAAFFATLQVCAMVSSLGYDSQFLPLEPRNQRDARQRPDAEIWRKAELKEQDMLWGKETFVLVDRPGNYDPIPLQFIYKLKVKDCNYSEGIPKALLVMMGNLQYEDEHGDTYAPTAKLWVIRAMAAIAAQEGLTMKKFDLTGAFLNATMPADPKEYVQIPAGTCRYM
jgi:hypothetical protein